jgi:hypothetical protein
MTMNDTELSKTLNSLLYQPLSSMTDQELAPWLAACGVMEHKAKPINARQSWTNRRVEAEAEIGRRQAIDVQ